MSTKSWKVVKDTDVRHIWQCEKEDCEEQPCVNVRPDFYQQGGNPVCTSCDQEMTYVRTEVRL